VAVLSPQHPELRCKLGVMCGQQTGIEKVCSKYSGFSCHPTSTGTTGLLVAVVPSGVPRYELKSGTLEPDDHSTLSCKSPGSRL
jgi:hypothetical protein